MRRAGLIAAALALACAAPGAQARAATAAQPGRCVVKYRPTLTRCAHCVWKSGAAFAASVSGVTALDAMHAQLGVTSVMPLFRSELEEQQLAASTGSALITASTLQSSWLARVQAAQLRYPRRTARAPARQPVPDLSHVYVMSFAPEIDAAAACRFYAEDPQVEWAQPETSTVSHVLPNDTYVDPDRNGTWATGAWGQAGEDLWGLKKIGFAQAWVRSKGEGVLVAVVDSGLDYAHPDIAANAWVNPCEDLNKNGQVDASDLNGKDDPCADGQGNGYADDLRGRHFIVDALSSDNDVSDHDGHGTHVAGTIAAIADNGRGIAGIAPKVTLMPVATGFGFPARAAGIVYAAMNGAEVINNSWGCGDPCGTQPVVEDAVRLAHDTLGAVVVFSAGNANADVASYSPQRMAEALTVSATTPSDQRASFSNFGTVLDVAAPGGSSGDRCDPATQTILSLRAAGTDTAGGPVQCDGALAGRLVVGTNYYRLRGTSMAAPLVSGTAALILSLRPTFTNEDVRQALRVSAFDANSSSKPGVDADLGAGRLRAYNAVLVESVLRARLGAPETGAVISKLATPSVAIRGDASGPGFARYELLYAPYVADPVQGWVPSTTWTRIGTARTTPVTNGSLGTWNISSLPVNPPYYSVRVSATATDGRRFEDVVRVRLTQGQLGDVNGDGTVNATDAQMALQMATGGLEPVPTADANLDGSVRASDALCILRNAVGSGPLPCGTNSSYLLTAAASGRGHGAIVGPSSRSSPTEETLADCPLPCALTLGSSETVTLTAVPAAGSEFSGWSGACSGAGSCTVTVNQPQAVTAAFEPANLLVNGGFESGKTAWSGWGTGKTLEAGGAYEGAQYAKLTLSSSAQRILTHSTVTVVAGRAYEVTAALRAAGTNAPVYARLRWRTAGGSLLRTDPAFGQTQGTTGWKVRSSGVVTAPANAGKLEVQVLANKGSSGAASVDGARVETR